MIDIIFLNNASSIWFLISFLCIIVELAIPGLFYFLSGSISALIIGIIVAFFQLGLTRQLSLFLGISVIIFLILKKWAEKNVRNEKNTYVSHVSKLIGKEGIVTQEITEDNAGQIKIHNEIWMAYASHNQKILVNTKVRIIAISGVHVIVQPLKDEEKK